MKLVRAKHEPSAPQITRRAFFRTFFRTTLLTSTALIATSDSTFPQSKLKSEISGEVGVPALYEKLKTEKAKKIVKFVEENQMSYPVLYSLMRMRNDLLYVEKLELENRTEDKEALHIRNTMTPLMFSLLSVIFVNKFFPNFINKIPLLGSSAFNFASRYADSASTKFTLDTIEKRRVNFKELPSLAILPEELRILLFNFNIKDIEANPRQKDHIVQHTSGSYLSMFPRVILEFFLITLALYPLSVVMGRITGNPETKFKNYNFFVGLLSFSVSGNNLRISQFMENDSFTDGLNMDLQDLAKFSFS
ncbi:MAG: hypothetical protein Q7S22_08620 [Candidatus Micrarchaeota archaeon]|nr:hypothetical protein [Candidatus Micrarchaeota archaeon]